MSPIVVALILLISGLALLFLELFIPSAGVLTVLAISALLFSVIWAFVKEGPVVGSIFFLAISIIVPAFISAALKWWPHTPIGRWMMLQPPTQEDVISSSLQQYDHLVGKEGLAKSDLLPSGAVVIDKITYDVVTDGTAIEKGDLIEVIEVDGTRIIVTKSTKQREILENKSANQAKDLLSQPIESLGISPLDDPLS